ncbi:otoferlin isoform X2 [Halyomorpha halys]|uniref:otoferlin isoform X2 n=1 Tax=Halyomorpha halys TaxID=286706 RepID=UPI0034D1823B
MITELLPDEAFEKYESPTSLYKINVGVLEANQVSWVNLQTRVQVKFGKERKFGRVKESSERPYYNENFVFHYEGTLEGMMDMILFISVLQYKTGLRRDKLLGNSRLDLGAIWTQPGHAIAEKWIVLTHPSDPVGEIRGYLNCEISIFPGGEITPYTEKERSDTSEMFLTESLGGGRLKARYIFGVHKGENISITKNNTRVFIRVFFAGLSGETTKRKDTEFPLWQEEIVFTELFPPMYNRFRIDVHIGKKTIVSKYLNLSSISDPTVNGFLPTYGPSSLYLYSPPYNFLGSILVSLETKTVYALYEHEKLLGVRRRRGIKLQEKLFWNMEEFALFGVIYEISMLKKDIKSQTEISVGLGFGAPAERPGSEFNIHETWSDKTVQMDETYMCLPITSAKQTLYTKEKLPDNRKRLFISNRLNNIGNEFGQEMLRLQFSLEHSPKTVEARLNTVMKNLINNCQLFKSSSITASTMLDKERLKTIITKLDAIINKAEEVLKSNSRLTTKFDIGLKVFRDIVNIVQDPQESFPQIVLTIQNKENIIAYAKIPPKDVLFSLKENERGINCGIIQSLFLTSIGMRGNNGFGGKIDILLWFGPFASIGYGLTSIPSGFQDISQDYIFPKAFVYSDINIFSCRVHLYQGHFLPCDEVSGLCHVYVKIYFNCRSEMSSTKETLSPVWMETLVIKDTIIYANPESIKSNPKKVVLEFWNLRNKEKNLIGRILGKPHVFLKDDKLQPPHYPPPLEWQRICDQGKVKGEILVAFELIQSRETTSADDVTASHHVIELPTYIKPTTKTYRFEILFWGIRPTKQAKMSSLTLPRIIIDCGSMHIESSVLSDPNYFPNFLDPPVLVDVELPENWYFAPPFVMRLFSSQAFGTLAFIGSEIRRNLRKHHLKFPSWKEWQQSRSKVETIKTSIAENAQNLESIRGSFYPYSEYIVEEEPLVELKKDIQPKEVENAEFLKVMDEKKPVTKWWWKLIPLSKKSYNFQGYIPLRIITSKSEVSSDKQPTYDWWTKYYDTLRLKKLPEKNESSENDGTIDKKLEEMKSRVKLRTKGFKFFTEELEKQPEYEGFQDIFTTLTMAKTSSSGKITTTYSIKAGIALYDWPAENKVTAEGFSLEQGIFTPLAKELNAVISIVVRVYIVRAHKLNSKHRFGKVDPYLIVSIPSQTINDSKQVIEQDSSPVFGRCYEFEGKLPFDSLLTISVMDKAINELIGETEIDIENRYYSRHRGTCGFQKSYSKKGYDAWRDAYKPSETLYWLCMSNNVPIPRYIGGEVLVGNKKFGTNASKIEDLKEELALTVLQNWHKIPFIGHKLLEEHVETRSLYNPSSQNVEQGKLEMWVDILPSRINLPPQVDITPRVPDQYELRAIIWGTKKVKLVDEGLMVGKRHTDIFVKGWIKGRIDMQKTDTHYASLTGEGFFNWRFIFNFSYDQEEEMIVLDDKSKKIPPVLYLQVWDRDRFVSNDYIGDGRFRIIFIIC